MVVNYTKRQAGHPLQDYPECLNSIVVNEEYHYTKSQAGHLLQRLP